MDQSTTLELLDARQERGLAIVRALRARIRRLAGSRWLVPSQSGPGEYLVDETGKTCTCPDHEDRGIACKHVHAVLFVVAGLTVTAVEDAPASTAPRRTYSQDWPAYHRAQVEEKERVLVLLRGLCDGIASPRQATGRPRLPLGDVVYAAAVSAFGTLSSRRSQGDVRACAERGLVGRAASYNSVLRYLEREDLAPLLRTLVQESAAPLAAIESQFAIDSTGFATCTYARWFDHKYGAERRAQRWVKCHAIVGTVTNVIAAVDVTDEHVGDSVMLRPLLASATAAGFRVQELSADKAYLSNDNLAAVEAAGAVPYVPFKSNSTPTGGSEAWRKMWHVFSARSNEFLAHYHRRSNVESTFSSLKRKFGAAVRARLPAAQVNEVLLRCLVHNLSMVVHATRELGVEPAFDARAEVVS